MNKEHFFPVWLIEKTGTFHEGIEWAGKKNIPALSATVPLCKQCNDDFGRELESPMAKIFDDLEKGHGLSDDEAELVVRWMWKLEGLYWVFANPRHIYTQKYTLRQRVLQPIDEIRGKLTLAVSLAKHRDPTWTEGAMGLDSINIHNAVFVSGVFSRVAIMILLSIFDDEIPGVFSKYRLLPARDPKLGSAKLFYPSVGFPTCSEAIVLLKVISPRISQLHDKLGHELQSKLRVEEKL